MPREPLRLNSETLAAHRPGALVAVALDAVAGIPRKRPTPYLLGRAGGFGPPSSGARGSLLGPTGAATAVLPIRGVLTQYSTISDCGEPCSYEQIEGDLLALNADPGVGRVVVDIDSNGGDVPGLEDMGARVRAAYDASGKLLLGYTPGNALSAAYWLLAMTCQGIYLSASGRMGAIGSCVVARNEARRLAKDGIEVYIGRRPAGKFKPNDCEPFDDVGKSRIDRLADEGAARFLAAVERARGIAAATVESWSADTFTGAHAVAAGLADGVGRLEEIVALAESWPRSKAA